MKFYYFGVQLNLMALSELDLTDRESWTCEHTSHIAHLLGFECDDRFAQAFHEFLEESIKSATVMVYIQIIATKHFSDKGCVKKRR